MEVERDALQYIKIGKRLILYGHARWVQKFRWVNEVTDSNPLGRRKVGVLD